VCGACPDGYEDAFGDGIQCIPVVDACETNNGGCGPAAYWKCTSIAGEPPHCEGVGECGADNGGCDQICTLNGSPVCACDPASVLESNGRACRSRWSTPMRLYMGETNSDHSAPKIAINSRGDAMVVWQQDAPGRKIWAQPYVAGSGWGTATAITGTEDGWRPQVGLDDEGNAIALWAEELWTQDDNPVGFAVRIAHYEAGSGWQAPTKVNEIPRWSTGEQVLLDAHGNITVAWLSDSGLWANRYEREIGWGTPTLLAAEAGHEPRIATDGEGNVVVAWQQFVAQATEFWAVRYDVEDGWGSPAQIDSDTASNVHSLQIASDKLGNTLAVWQQRDGAGAHFDVWANRFEAGGGWGTPTMIGMDESELPDQASNEGEVALASNAEGAAVAVWTLVENDSDRAGGGSVSLWAGRYQPGSGWSVPVMLQRERARPRNPREPQVALDAQGNAIAIWEQFDGVGSGIWASRYDAERGWSAAMLIQEPTGRAERPQVAFDSQGRATAVWDQTDNSRRSIWISYFE
jgi:hypothetical protein